MDPPNLDKGLEDLDLPVFIVASQSGAFARVGLHHQSLHLDQEWAYGVVLSTERTQDTASVLLLEVVVVLQHIDIHTTGVSSSCVCVCVSIYTFSHYYRGERLNYKNGTV
jgi:hypothetical protein